MYKIHIPVYNGHLPPATWMTFLIQNSFFSVCQDRPRHPRLRVTEQQPHLRGSLPPLPQHLRRGWRLQRLRHLRSPRHLPGPRPGRADGQGGAGGGHRSLQAPARPRQPVRVGDRVLRERDRDHRGERRHEHLASGRQLLQPMDGRQRGRRGVGAWLHRDHHRPASRKSSSRPPCVQFGREEL